MNRKKKLELALVVIWTIVAYIITSMYGGNYLFSAFFFLVIPSIYFFLRNKEIIRKTLIVSIGIVAPLTVIANYLAHKDGAWMNYSPTQTFVLGIVPIEDFLWGTLYFIFMISFYEYFFDIPNKKQGQVIPPIFFSTLKVLFILTCIAVPIFILYPSFSIPYIYILIIIFAFILFPLLILCKYRHFINSILLSGVYFTFMSFLYEHVANMHNQWSFPGNHFIGHINYFGYVIPVEEFIWLFLAMPALLVYYEFFSDDRR